MFHWFVRLELNSETTKSMSTVQIFLLSAFSAADFTGYGRVGSLQQLEQVSFEFFSARVLSLLRVVARASDFHEKDTPDVTR